MEPGLSSWTEDLKENQAKNGWINLGFKIFSFFWDFYGIKMERRGKIKLKGTDRSEIRRREEIIAAGDDGAAQRRKV